MDGLLFDSFVQVIDLWESPGELGRDILVPRGTVKQWRRRNRIPAEYWTLVASSAKRRGFADVTVETLARLAARQLPACQEAVS